MKIKSFLICCLLTLVLIVTSLSIIEPVLAQVSGGPHRGRYPRQCALNGTCDGQPLNGSSLATAKKLTILDYNSVDPDLFVTGVTGASSDPADVVQLVDNAISVWESAFAPGSLPNLTLDVGWADFNAVNVSQGNGTLFVAASNLNRIDDFRFDDDKEDISDLSAAIAGDVMGLHICGAPAQSPPQSNDCSQTNPGEATILFNSAMLMDKASGRPIKIFLDTNPFNSSAFGPINQLGINGIGNVFRVGRSASFSEPFVVDLFTVALHEVGHALGFSQVNGLPPTAHISKLDLPDVLSEYLPFSTRKCPSRTDIEVVKSVGSYVPNSPPYAVINPDPCSDIRLDEQPLPELDRSRWKDKRRQIDIRLPNRNLIRKRDFVNSD